MLYTNKIHKLLRCYTIKRFDIYLQKMNKYSTRYKSTILQYLSVTKKSRTIHLKRTAVNLSYKLREGDGGTKETIPIIVLHGILGCKKNWDGLAKTIMNITRKTVVTVDLRNHGNSPHDASHKYEDLAADILQLLRKLDINKACLLGHSMGGRTAMYMGLTTPEIVSGIIIVDISPISTPLVFKEQVPKLMAALKTISFEKINKLSIARREAKKNLKDLISDDILMSALLKNVKQKSGVIRWNCNLDGLIKNFNYIASFPNLKHKQYLGPTLFIGGQKSDCIPADDLPGIRELFPQAVIVYVPNTGHYLHAEDPKTFLERTIKFLKELDSNTTNN